MKLPDKYEVSADALHNLYNVKCELCQLRVMLADFVKKDVLKPLVDAEKAISAVVAPMESAEEKHDNEIREAARDLHLSNNPAVYSCNNYPAENVHYGVVVFERNEGKIKYKSEPMVNPTYGDAFRAFQQSIVETDDQHHVFFEGVMYLGISEGRVLYELVAGS